MNDDELVTLPKSLIENLLDNDIKSREYTSRVAIETSKTNRMVLIAGIIAVCAVLIVWVLTPGDVQVENKSTSVSDCKGGDINAKG